MLSRLGVEVLQRPCLESERERGKEGEVGRGREVGEEREVGREGEGERGRAREGGERCRERREKREERERERSLLRYGYLASDDETWKGSASVEDRCV